MRPTERAFIRGFDAGQASAPRVAPHPPASAEARAWLAGYDEGRTCRVWARSGARVSRV